MALFEDFNCGTLPLHNLNFRTIILVPKTNEAKQIQQYRLMCLLNVSFKIFTKVATNRVTSVVFFSIRCISRQNAQVTQAIHVRMGWSMALSWTPSMHTARYDSGLPTWRATPAAPPTSPHSLCKAPSSPNDVVFEPSLVRCLEVAVAHPWPYAVTATAAHLRVHGASARRRWLASAPMRQRQWALTPSCAQRLWCKWGRR